MSTITLQNKIMATKAAQSEEWFKPSQAAVQGYKLGSIHEALTRLVADGKLITSDGEYRKPADLSGYAHMPWRTFPNSELGLEPRLGAL